VRIQFLELFDVYEGKVAEKVLEAMFETKQELVEDIDFGGDLPLSPPPSRVHLRFFPIPSDAFYQTLTPHTSFLARVYFNHLRKLEDPRLIDLEPVVTALGFFIQAEWTKLVVLLEAEERDEEGELEQEFVVSELVGIAVNVDYGDEIGRRKMFELMRELSPRNGFPKERR
jgi:condensin complex subunit 3